MARHAGATSTLGRNASGGDVLVGGDLDIGVGVERVVEATRAAADHHQGARASGAVDRFAADSDREIVVEVADRERGAGRLGSASQVERATSLCRLARWPGGSSWTADRPRSSLSENALHGAASKPDGALPRTG